MPYVKEQVREGYYEIIDEMGDFYEEVYESGDLKLIQLYDNLRSVAEDEPEDQFPAVVALLKYIDNSGKNLQEQKVNMKKNVLSENMKRFGTKNLAEQEKYQTLGQQGEIPTLDPEADTAHSEQTLDRLAKSYEQIKPKRLDMSEFKNDVRDLVSIYKDKPANSATMAAYMNAFRELYPTVQTRSDFKGILTTVTSKMSHLLAHARSIAQGDTSNYGYRVHPWQKSKGI